MQAKLENRGYKVFLDVDNIGSGEFPEQIDRAIRGCKDFLLILSPGMLDRCVDEEDWVRHEIMLAEECGKNIVGVSLPGFMMPEPQALPEPLRDIPSKQVFLWSHEYRNASIDKIVNNMEASKAKKKRTKRTWTLVLGVVVLAVVGAWIALSVKPEPQVEVEKPDPQQMLYLAVRDTFDGFVRQGDSLLSLVPNPTKAEDFTTFMHALGHYQEAQAFKKAYPSLALDSVRLDARIDSLNQLRVDRMRKELDATKKFLDVDNQDFALFRFQNAQTLATEEDRDLIESVGKRIR